MKVLLSWLREFAPDIEGDPDELGETLSALGLAVEETTVTGDNLDGVVLARVLDLRPHPNADKIQIVDVDVGAAEALQVCCGAFNLSVGDLVPFATVGTVMPNGMEIVKRKIRGEISNGMCCAASEIGFGEDSEGVMLLTEGTSGAVLGSAITDVLGIDLDVLWDLEVNANRPDAMSVAGIARDLAAVLGVPFCYPEHPVAVTGEQVSSFASVDLLDPTLCGRFAARVLRNVVIGPSPQWIQNRLLALGMRPINNIVDVSNYVMLELGQPNHTYDLRALPAGHLRVRRAYDGERITTLDGAERVLGESDGIIADHSDSAIGIAGVMGGISTEISASTTDVLLEMAWWDPPSISRTVKKLNLATEASVRFRRGADYGMNIDRALDRFVSLINPIGASCVAGQIDERGNLPDPAPITVRPSKINKLLGTTLDSKIMRQHLESIGFDTSRAKENFSVTVPSWRWDTQTETDVAEEVARLFGYKNIVRTVPKGKSAGGLTDYQKDRRLVRSVLVGLGCDETNPMPFLAPGDLSAAGLPEQGVTLSNPLVHEESVLRTSLMPGQLKAIKYNQSHRVGPVAFFEIGHVFLPSQEDQLLPDEREYLSVALAGEDALAAAAVVEVLDQALSLPNLTLRSASPPGMHPTRSAEIAIAGEARGYVGEVDSGVLASYGVSGRVGWIELDLGAVLNGPYGTKKYKPVSKFPSSDIDLAFEVPEDIPAASVLASLRKGGGELLVRLELFDIYRGKAVTDGTRGLTFRLRFQAKDRTLTEVEVAAVREACIGAVQRGQTGAMLRS